VAITPDGKTAFVTHAHFGGAQWPPPAGADLGNSVSTIDVKSRTKHSTDITVGALPWSVVFTLDGKTAFLTSGLGTVSTIDVKTRTKSPTDIPVGAGPGGMAVTPDGKTAFVANYGREGSGNSVSTIDVKTRTKHPTDITVGGGPFGVAVTPCRR
jgi:YVTN family beta-propeller protein